MNILLEEAKVFLRFFYLNGCLKILRKLQVQVEHFGKVEQ